MRANACGNVERRGISRQDTRILDRYTISGLRCGGPSQCLLRVASRHPHPEFPQRIANKKPHGEPCGFLEETGDDVPVVAFPKPDQLSYALSPCELMSRPSRSASASTRKPTVYFTIRKASSATTPDNTTVINTPCAWIHTCDAMP